jgi:hypothetical protein
MNAGFMNTGFIIGQALTNKHLRETIRLDLRLPPTALRNI